MFPEPTELLLIGCLKRINLDPKIQIKYVDTKNPREISHVTNGIIFLCSFNISHFSFTSCLEVMSKRTQEDASEERVTAKSKPMMNLIARSSERVPSAQSSTASESPEKTRHESRSPLSPQVEKYDRTVRPVVCSKRADRPVVCAHSSSYSQWNVDKTWSSQEWKSDELKEDRTVRPVVCPHSERINSLLKTMRQNQNCR